MAFARLSARSVYNNDASESSCNDSTLFERCQHPHAIQFIFWVLVLYTISVLLCKLGFKVCDDRRRKATGVSNSLEEYHRLISLPYPKLPSGKYKGIFMKEQENSTPTLVDPFLVINGFDNSLISKDGSFKRIAIPEPILKRNPSALDLSKEQIMVHLDPIIRMHDKESAFLPPASPPPAYVRSPRGEA